MIHQKLNLPPWLLAVVAMITVQLSSALSVPVVAQVGPAGAGWLRMVFGALLILLFTRPNFSAIRRRDIPALLALGVATGFMAVCFLAAISYIPLGTAVAIEFMGPLLVAALASHSRRALIWPALALGGVLLMTEPWQGEINFLGAGFALAAGICWGLYNLLTQHVGDRFSGVSGLAFTIPIATVATAPFGVPQLLSHDFEWWIILAAAGLALMAPVFAFALEMLALRRMTHTAFGTLLSLEPSFGILLGALVLTQIPTPLQLLGITVVIIAGAAAQRDGRRTA